MEPGCYFIDALLNPAMQSSNTSKFLNCEEIVRFKGFGGVRIESDLVWHLLYSAYKSDTLYICGLLFSFSLKMHWGDDCDCPISYWFNCIRSGLLETPQRLMLHWQSQETRVETSCNYISQKFQNRKYIPSNIWIVSAFSSTKMVWSTFWYLFFWCCPSSHESPPIPDQFKLVSEIVFSHFM